jgi:predicted DNA-binding protein (MmcQ/YjbR family)
MTTQKSVADQLRKAALAYPGAYEETPWGERVTKVNGKIFAFFGRGDRGLSFSLKLPQSNALALTFPFASPTAYGLGKSGWVSGSFKPEDDVPLGLILEWLDESYRAIAPKKLLKELEGNAPKKVPEKPAKKRAKKKGAVLVVSDDELRLDRAGKAIEERGLGQPLLTPIDEAFGHLAKKKLQAALVDLGRRPADALELGVQLAHALGKTPLVFAGARDTATVKRARAAAKSVRAAFREAPGDPKVISELEAALG